IERQAAILESGGKVEQETRGWSEARGETYSQRSKEDAHDYRYFPEPDLPPLAVEQEWIDALQARLPELPAAKAARLSLEYDLNAYDAARLAEERAIADYFERAAKHAAPGANGKAIANWILGDLLALINASGEAGAPPTAPGELKIPPEALADLAKIVTSGQINQASGKQVLTEMFTSGRGPAEIVAERGLSQISDEALISRLVRETLEENPKEVASYRAGKAGVLNFLFGQVMKKAAGKANPQVVRSELEWHLSK
ncbi:MAG: Asp-tRNA(Asn)/Glu-tRNA(Gln) amidotransferase GatCAB subunit B, partial [Anaerolineae bacterium]